MSHRKLQRPRTFNNLRTDEDLIADALNMRMNHLDLYSSYNIRSSASGNSQMIMRRYLAHPTGGLLLGGLALQL